MKKFNKLKNFLELIFNIDKNISFTIADIGAHPYKQSEEPFHILIDFFPNSKIYAFDIDKQQLENLNKSAKKGIRYFSHALGKKNEKRKFYITENPGCSSLYKPNENLMKLTTNLMKFTTN